MFHWAALPSGRTRSVGNWCASLESLPVKWKAICCIRWQTSRTTWDIWMDHLNIQESPTTYLQRTPQILPAANTAVVLLPHHCFWYLCSHGDSGWHSRRFKCFTDGKSAISKIQQNVRKGANRVRQPYKADILSLIQTLMADIRHPMWFHWIKGHQDSLTSYAKLPRAVRMNIDADFLATGYRLRGRLRPSCDIDHVSEQLSISILFNGTRMKSQYDGCIR